MNCLLQHRNKNVKPVQILEIVNINNIQNRRQKTRSVLVHDVTTEESSFK